MGTTKVPKDVGTIACQVLLGEGSAAHGQALDKAAHPARLAEAVQRSRASKGLRGVN